MSADQKILDRIMALFAKAENTQFEAERDAFTAKAFDLMAKYAVDQSQLVGQDKPQFVKQAVDIATKSMPHRLLFQAAAKANDVAAFMVSGKSYQTVVGLPDDITLTKALYASLVMQMESDLARAVKPSWEHGKTFNHAFRLAFASRVNKRLEQLKAASSASTPGSEIVLRDKAANTQAAVRDLVNNPIRNAKASARSVSGRFAGDAAGSRARLGQDSLGDSRTALV